MWAIGILLIASAWQLGPGLASGLSSSSDALASGEASVSRCDADGVQSVFNFAFSPPYPVQSVTVAGLASACGSQTLSVTVDNGLTTSSGSATVPSGGGAVIVTLSSTIAWSDSMRTDLVVS